VRDALAHRRLDARGDLGLGLLEPAELGPEHDEHARRRRRRHGRAAPAVAEDRDLAEEVAGAERSDLLAVRRDDSASLDEDEKRVAGRALADNAGAFADVLRVEPGRDLAKLGLAQRREERDR